MKIEILGVSGRKIQRIGVPGTQCSRRVLPFFPASSLFPRARTSGPNVTFNPECQSFIALAPTVSTRVNASDFEGKNKHKGDHSSCQLSCCTRVKVLVFLEATAARLPEGVLPYISYTGTCRPSGYGFSTVRS